VPPGIVAFLERAMAKDPDQRFQTGEAFAKALRASLTAGGAGGGAARPTQPAPNPAPQPASGRSDALDIEL